MDDRRVFERMQARFPLKFLEATASEESSGETFDISANGMGLTSRSSLPVSSRLEVWLQIPEQAEPFYTRAEVVWSLKNREDGLCRAGVRLEKAELMGLARALWAKAR